MSDVASPQAPKTHSEDPPRLARNHQQDTWWYPPSAWACGRSGKTQLRHSPLCFQKTIENVLALDYRI